MARLNKETYDKVNVIIPSEAEARQVQSGSMGESIKQLAKTL